MKQLALVIFCFLMSLGTFAQSTAIGAKGGLTIGLQRWNGQQREALLSYNASLVYEMIKTETFSYLFDFGYHVKGSALRSQARDLQGNIININTSDKFNNLSFIAGAKSTLDINIAGGDFYYMLGVRLDYTINEDIKSVLNFKDNINRINYGVTAGAGVEFKLSDRLRGFIELQFSPDFSQQVYAPPGTYIANVNGTTFTRTWQEQKVINIPLELTVGAKFLRY